MLAVLKSRHRSFYKLTMIENFRKHPYIITLLCCIFLISLTLSSCTLETGAINSQNVYQKKIFHNPEGIGKFYLGREIAKVMGHEGAGWLERDSRSYGERPDLAIAALDLKPTDIVADIGAGTGYFSFRINPLIPEGKVLAVDVQPEMLDLIEFVKKQENITNVETILGEVNDPKLPESQVNLALMVDAYHEFEYPREMMLGIVKGLQPGGRVVLLEYRGENPLIMIKGLHKMTEKQVKKEMEAVGLVFEENKDILPQQHFLVFRKPVA